MGDDYTPPPPERVERPKAVRRSKARPKASVDPYDDLHADESVIMRRLSIAPRRCGFYRHTDGSVYDLPGCDERLLDMANNCTCDTLQRQADDHAHEVEVLRRHNAALQRQVETLTTERSIARIVTGYALQSIDGDLAEGLRAYMRSRSVWSEHDEGVIAYASAVWKRWRDCRAPPGRRLQAPRIEVEP